MASWMVHLRIADILLDKFEDLEKTDFIMGNIAPDSGVPSEDWSYYVPSSKVSHFRDESKKIQLQPYLDRYFEKAVRKNYNTRQFSFYLEALQDRNALVWKIKADWYDLDFLFLSRQPHFRAFEIYKNAVGFRNTYMDIFAPDAFDNRREYITGFYDKKRENPDRNYPYLTEHRMDRFVTEASEAVYNNILRLLSP